MFYLIYVNDEFELPAATAETLKETAAWLHVTPSAVCQAVRDKTAVHGYKIMMIKE
jgi:hypothetical protein